MRINYLFKKYNIFPKLVWDKKLNEKNSVLIKKYKKKNYNHSFKICKTI